MKTKICRICKKELSLDEFADGTLSPKGFRYKRNDCKECHRAVNRESKKKWALDHPEKARAAGRRSYRLYIVKPGNKEKARKRAVKYRQENIERYMLQGAIHRAKLKNLEINITIDDIIIPEFCPILGIKLNKNNHNNRNDSPSLDRIDVSKGYVKGNIAVISSLANSMKNNATYEEMEIFIKNILNYMKPSSS